MGLFSRSNPAPDIGLTIQLQEAEEDRLEERSPALQRYPWEGRATPLFERVCRMSLDEVLADPMVQQLRPGEQATVLDFEFEEENDWRDGMHCGNWIVTAQQDSLVIDFWHMYRLKEGSFEAGDTECWRLEYVIAISIKIRS